MSKITRSELAQLVKDDFEHYEPDMFIAQWKDLYGSEVTDDYDEIDWEN